MHPLIPLALATAAMSFTISKSTMPVVSAVREWVSAKSRFLKDLLRCPYCTSNWVSVVVLVACPIHLVHTQSVVVDWVLTWQALVGAAMVPVFGILFIAGK